MSVRAEEDDRTLPSGNGSQKGNGHEKGMALFSGVIRGKHGIAS